MNHFNNEPPQTKAPLTYGAAIIIGVIFLFLYVGIGVGIMMIQH